MRATTVKLSVFAAVMLLIFTGLIVVFSQARFTGTREYHAVFTDVSGLGVGDKVRIAGVPVGKITGVEMRDDHDVDVSFDVDTSQTLLAGNRALVRYENLVGDRFLEIAEGPGDGVKLPEGGTIPVGQTEPALDLDLLLGGLKPLLSGMDAQQINDVSTSIVQILQGQGGSVSALLANTGSLTNSLADRDRLIGSVIDNLNQVLGTIDDNDRQFTQTIDSLQTLVAGLSEDRGPIGEALPRLAAGTGDLASLLQAERPDFQTTIAETRRAMAQAHAGEGDIDRTLERLPEDYRKLIRVGSYGSFFNFFLCATTFKVSGPDGTTIRFTSAAATTGRCAKIE